MHPAPTVRRRLLPPGYLLTGPSFSPAVCHLPSSSDLQELYLRGSVSITMTVYSDFFAYKGGIYTHILGPADGGHAVKVTRYPACAPDGRRKGGKKGGRT